MNRGLPIALIESIHSSIRPPPSESSSFENPFASGRRNSLAASPRAAYTAVGDEHLQPTAGPSRMGPSRTGQSLAVTAQAEEEEEYSRLRHGSRLRNNSHRHWHDGAPSPDCGVQPQVAGHRQCGQSVEADYRYPQRSARFRPKRFRDETKPNRGQERRRQPQGATERRFFVERRYPNWAPSGVLGGAWSPKAAKWVSPQSEEEDSEYDHTVGLHRRGERRLCACLSHSDLSDGDDDSAEDDDDDDYSENQGVVSGKKKRPSNCHDLQPKLARRNRFELHRESTRDSSTRTTGAYLVLLTTAECGTKKCDKTVKLLSDFGLAFIELPLKACDSAFITKALTGSKSLPQLFSDGQLVGGYSEIKSWVKFLTSSV
ncbi:hypothetical protein GNI_094590 [Gregarina niphandrodes]|uniref:Glutaredoxin n=1 Tax=Gregarina niphandrodes TaxID=110365 RepID=A0A023B545_GRENI|nr:hypothetical protein GNI_094590 [Gregarina niphandrodes]EZG58483.1 hypothetical protein GNI_094590 [Gregarina niphandrodes]|eukprot:XP_011130956.1 hypothetical protein GNI_094590 [Gregarina niphandrodes]